MALGRTTLILAATIAALIASACGCVCAEQAVVFSEDFDDGDWTSNPFWIASPADPSVSISAAQYVSAPFSLKIDASNSSGAIRASSGLRAFDQPFTCTFSLYVESIPEEGIPWCLMDASGGVVALIFLLPGGKVQLTTWKADGGYAGSTVPYALTYGRWHDLRITYDGAVQALYIDGAAEPAARVDLPFRATPARISLGNFQLAHTGTYYVDDIAISAEDPGPQGPPGRVYVQFCSDTSTGGLATSQNPIRFPASDETYTSPTGQAAQVMAESYRMAHLDSLGNPLKITWYMNCGSIYSCGIDTSPILPYELLEDNHGDSIARWGDEMAFHYHTWAWTDPNSDGVFQWNQTETFLECLTDFDQTIAHLVLDRGFYPCSFRSGWNWMDRDWELYLDELFPYRFEGRYFARGWVPYHPDADNYAVPGDLKGWESYYDYTPAWSETEVEDTFVLAESGVDQVVCIYSHLKETDFANQITLVCGHLAAAHQRHPEVEYEFLTARECMLKWRKGSDVTPPLLTVSTSDSGGLRTANISTDEEIYQKEPFVARRGVDGVYSHVPCQPAGTNRWTVTYDPADTRQIAVAVTDWFGNAAVKALPVPLRLDVMDVTSTPTSAEVRWDVTPAARTRVECMRMPDGPASVIVDESPRAPFRAAFAGLLPGHVYRLRLSAETASGERAEAPPRYVLTRLADAVVVDNLDAGFTVTGAWTTGSSAGGRYGPDYRYATTSAAGTSHADWTATAGEAGAYRVYAWWSQGSNRSTTALYTVTWRGQQFLAAVNQQTDGGVWNLLGTFQMNAAESVTVRLANTAPAGYVVIADAVKLEKAFPSVCSPGLARLLPEGESLALDGLAVTAVFGDAFYAQDAGRSSGVTVQGTGAAVGDIVSVAGDLALISGERSVINAMVTVQGAGAETVPLNISNASAHSQSASPVCTAGLLVTVRGRVVEAGQGLVALDDGSGIPVRVETARLSKVPSVGDFVVVTGAQGAALTEGLPAPLIRPRSSVDLAIVSP